MLKQTINSIKKDIFEQIGRDMDKNINTLIYQKRVKAAEKGSSCMVMSKRYGVFKKGYLMKIRVDMELIKNG